MKTNTSMRVAVLLMALVLMTSCFVSGTFAKYVTTYTANDDARVAYWGFDNTDTLVFDLFAKEYVDVLSNNDDDVIAPGTQKFASFRLVNAEGTLPEVKYTLTVDASASTCDEDIKNNPNIVWYFGSSPAPASGTFAEGSWDAMLAALNGVSQTYAPHTIPSDSEKIQIGWKWIFDVDAASDVRDTNMGNKATLDDVNVIITVTATQVGADD